MMNIEDAGFRIMRKLDFVFVVDEIITPLTLGYIR